MSTTVDPVKLLDGFLVVLCIGFVLYGVLSAQAFYYWSTYPKDHWGVRALVAIVWVLESLHVAFCIHIVHTYFVLSLRDPEHATKIIWSIGATLILGALISIQIQGFYIWRIWRLGNQAIVSGALTVLLLFRNGLALASGGTICKFATFPDLLDKNGAHLQINLSVAVVALTDLSITSVMAFYLYKGSFHMSSRSSKFMVTKLIKYAINTGAIAFLTTTGILIAFNVTRDNIIFLGFSEVIVKIYGNSMLAWLNARQRISEAATSVELSRWSAAAAGTGTHDRPTVVQISKDTIIVDSDLTSWHDEILTRSGSAVSGTQAAESAIVVASEKVEHSIV
ncbi:hypothetical protein BC629DRAFT_1739463 [Irpex lacteus]|nr:hypothetical protein BC629DRAFT_1739463 [Irpex lacteus]